MMDTDIHTRIWLEITLLECFFIFNSSQVLGINLVAGVFEVEPKKKKPKN